MKEAASSGSFGAFGKIPALGDFLRLNLPADFVKHWDDWLQAGMLTARDHLGARWNDCYLSAPIWRFSLPAGTAGNRAILGILMPSVDRVGRQYPLTLATTCPAEKTVLCHFTNSSLFDRLEEIALETLDQDLDRTALATALRPLSLAPAPTNPVVSNSYFGTALPEQILAAQRLAKSHGETAVWTARLGLENKMLLSAGLPDTGQFNALFDPISSVWQPDSRAKSA